MKPGDLITARERCIMWQDLVGLVKVKDVMLDDVGIVLYNPYHGGSWWTLCLFTDRIGWISTEALTEMSP